MRHQSQLRTLAVIAVSIAAFASYQPRASFGNCGQTSSTATYKAGQSLIALFSDLERAPSAIESAPSVLAEIRRAYDAAPTIDESIRMTASLVPRNQDSGGDLGVPPPPPQEWTIEYGERGAVRAWMPSHVLVALDGTAYLYSKSDERRYFERTLEGPLGSAFLDVGLVFPTFTTVLRHRTDAADAASDLTRQACGLLPGAKLTGVRSSGNRGATQFLWESDVGALCISFDNQTRMQHEIVVEMANPDAASPIGAIRMRAAVSSYIADALKTPIAFEKSGRTRVSDIQSLPDAAPSGSSSRPDRFIAEEQAPSAVFTTLSGQQVDLDGLRGKVVVLCFWTSDKGAGAFEETARRYSLNALQLIETFAKLHQGDDRLAIYAVHITGTHTRAAESSTVKDFWGRQGLSLTPVLLAPSSPLVVAGTPLVVVIGRDGVVADAHSGHVARPSGVDQQPSSATDSSRRLGFDESLIEVLEHRVQKLFGK